nr:hypothetical protein [uncultured Flavobacterium sp.]
MKKVIFIIAIFLNLGCNISEKKITQIWIKKVNLDIDTAVRINCAEFDSSFKGLVKVYKIKDQKKIKKLDSIMNTMCKSDKIENLDTRKKIIILYSDNSKETLCVDRFGVMLNGNSMKIDNQSLQFIQNL